MAKANTATRGALQDVPFLWEGRDKRGRRVTGKSLARDDKALRVILRTQGIAPLSVRRQSTRGRRGKVSPNDIAVFSRQTATMLSAGVPLVQGFEIVGAGLEKAAMQKLVQDIRTDIEGGSSLREALSRRPEHFSDLYVNLVAAGEQAGALDTLLDKIANYLEKTEALKKKVRKAMVYPAMVLAMAVLVTIALMVWVIPQFESLFAGFGAELPFFTQVVINLSRAVNHNLVLVLLVLIGGPWGIYTWVNRSAPVRAWLSRTALQLPAIGPILRNSALARYCRTLATLFSAGVPLVEALESVAGATGNSVYRDAVLRVREEVATGQRLQRAMDNTGLFPNLIVQMIGVGEEAGALDTMAAKVATFYETEVDNAVDALADMLEPIIMAVLGTLIGGLVMSMYLPIFKLGGAV